MHIDSSFVPLAPKKVLVNPEFVDPARLPPMFKSWEVLVAPHPDPPPLSAWRFRVSQCSPWISINVLMLDPKRVVVEASQITLIRALRVWGFEPIPCPFLSYAPFGAPSTAPPWIFGGEESCSLTFSSKTARCAKAGVPNRTPVSAMKAMPRLESDRSQTCAILTRQC